MFHFNENLVLPKKIRHHGLPVRELHGQDARATGKMEVVSNLGTKMYLILTLTKNRTSYLLITDH